MKRQGLHVPKLKKSRLSTKKSFLSSITPAGLAAVLLFGSGSALLPAVVNAGARQNLVAQQTQQIAQNNPVTANIIFVNPQTGADSAGAGSEATPFKTISYAIGQAKAGTTIQLAVGNYSQETGETFPLLIRQGVTLRGDDANRGQGVIIVGSGKYTSPTFASQNITIRAENQSTITGLTVTNPESRGTALWVESTNPVIASNTFVGSKRDGVFVTGNGNPIIENNIFTQNEGNGIAVVRSAKGEIKKNLFQSTGFGIAVGDQSSPLISENQIIQNNGGIVVNGKATPVLRGNTIQENRDNGVVVTQDAQPDLGTQENPGKNFIRNNGSKEPKRFFDVLNATRTNTIIAVGNDIDEKRISGKVEFVAAVVEPPPGGGTPTTFKDVPANFWAKPYIDALAARGAITGFPDSTFKPNDPVTRAQFAVIVNKALAPAAKREGKNFRDVKTDFWGFAAIQAAVRGGYLSGYEDGSFRPQQQIPRVQALVALASGLGLSAENQNIISFYSDAAQIPQWGVGAVAAATARGLVVNYPNVKQLNPSRQATRAEVAAFVYQALASNGQVPPINSPYLVQVR
ncbi:MAG: DUF1565 domain-containing protein [Scytonematopsis contorta HA4267-MV1]|jgi:parallel beta-helix repeat protein|nr:DUF1565 domain-containing protein [Scytonematopsis contorta HA4267-MV1]